jgi:hypothetical protein
MSLYRTLVIGSTDSLAHSRVKELCTFLSTHGVELTQASRPALEHEGAWDLIFFVSFESANTPESKSWIDKIKDQKISGRVLTLYQQELPEEWRAVLDPEIEVGAEHALAESLMYLFEEASLPDELKTSVGTPITFDLNAAPEGEVELTAMEAELGAELDPPQSFAEDKQQEASLSIIVEENSMLDLQISGDELSAPEKPQVAETEESQNEIFIDEGPAAESEALFESSEDLGEIKFEEAPASFETSDEVSNDVSADVDWGEALSEGLANEPVAESSLDGLEESLLESALDIGESSIEEKVASEEKIISENESVVSDLQSIEHPDSDIRAPLAGRETFNADLSMNELFQKDEISYHSDLSSSENQATPQDSENSVGSNKDLATLQKYAALKERESRERESTIKVLKGQLSKMDVKLSRSETERRRLTLETAELKNQNSALEEDLSQKKFYLQKVESQHQEELRGLSLRLDNAVFQATKSQNKLEEFRERVRNDFMKIRTQERELFNKLELQKRDAEALLASKDEQLLNQKREIDRLQYELDNLRERMIDETEKAEDRSSRLSRAVQSLKLANDMLSGLTEEVLPAAGEKFEDTSREDEDEVA